MFIDSKNIKMSILSKATYRCNAISNSNDTLQKGKKKKTLKLTGNHKTNTGKTNLPKAEAITRKKNKLEALYLMI